MTKSKYITPVNVKKIYLLTKVVFDGVMFVNAGNTTGSQLLK